MALGTEAKTCNGPSDKSKDPISNIKHLVDEALSNTRIIRIQFFCPSLLTFLENSGLKILSLFLNSITNCIVIEEYLQSIQILYIP